jgi:hypothetical protein
MKSFLTYLKLELQSYLLRLRWLLPIPVFAYLCIHANNYLTSYLAQIAPQLPNRWDLLFVVFGDQDYLYLGLGLLFIFLISDLLPESNLGQMKLLRLKSRKKWWLVKVSTLFILTLFFLLMLFVFVSVIACITLPGTTGYSELAQFGPMFLNLDARFFVELQPPSPAIYFVQNFGLLLLGFFSFGMILLLVNLITDRYYLGLIAGFSILLLSYISVSLSGPPSWARFLPGAHLSYVQIIPIRSISLWQSFLYWLILITTTVSIGFLLCKKRDFSALQNSTEK